MKWKRVEAQGTKAGGRSAAGMCSVNGKLLLMGGYMVPYHQRINIHKLSTTRALVLKVIDRTTMNCLSLILRQVSVLM